MSQDAIPTTIQDRYSSAWIRGRRITRFEENQLGHFRLDADTAWQLGTHNAGLFVGSCDPNGTIDRLQKLKQSDSGTRWVIVTDTKDMAAFLLENWFQIEQPRKRRATTFNQPVVRANIILATPENLRRIGDADRQQIAGIILLDMHCRIHRARGIMRGNFASRNDRPQWVANFRNCIAEGNWLPPLILLAEAPAKSINTDFVAHAYCLDAWWFVDGTTLRCGPPPARNFSNSTLDGDVNRIDESAQHACKQDNQEK